MRTCPSCGSSVPDIAKFCGGCGNEIKAPIITNCRVCHREMGPRDRFCPSCGFDTSSLGASSDPAVPQPTYAVAPSPVYNPNPSSYQTPYYETMPPIPQQYAAKCRNCGYAVNPGEQKCSFCGARILSFNRKDRAGQAGGILIAVGILNVLLYGLLMTAPFVLGTPYMVIGAVMAVLTFANVFVIWAGFQAIKRQAYRASVIASVITFVSFLFIFGIIALVFVAMSKEAFQQRKQLTSAGVRI